MATRPTKRKKKTPSWLHTEINLFADHTDKTHGFALISATILLGILLTFSFVLLNSSINTRFVGNVFQQALSAEQIAEAGLHKAMYCLNATSGSNCGGTYGVNYTGESNVAFSGGKFSTVVSGTGSTRTVTAVGSSVTGQTKTVKSDMVAQETPDAGVIPTIFGAALQVGADGLSMTNSAEIVGDNTADADVVSVGDISCTNSAQLTGHVMVTRSGGKINACKITKNAYADILTNNVIQGNAYYKTNPSGIAGSTVSGTKYPNSTTPSAVASPNLNLQTWKDMITATAGTTRTSGLSVSSGTVTITDVRINGDVNISNSAKVTVNGPLRITGNLNMSNSAELTIKGPLWVGNQLLMSNSTVVKLDSSFGGNSTLLIADNGFNIGNSVQVNGSGTTPSVIILATNANGYYTFSNSATATIIYAPNAFINMTNSASFAAVVARGTQMSNSSKVNPGNLNVFSAPIDISIGGSGSGGGDPSGWIIKKASWREFK